MQAERERLFKGWQALRAACRQQHPSGPGGAAICICGKPCGGSEACSMLAEIRDLICYLPIESLPVEWSQKLDLLKSVI